jgi:hypothetical protein
MPPFFLTYTRAPRTFHVSLCTFARVYVRVCRILDLRLCKY